MDRSELVNPDLAKERQNSTINLDEMKCFLGEMIYFNQENYHSALKYSNFEKFFQVVHLYKDQNFMYLYSHGPHILKYKQL